LGQFCQFEKGFSSLGFSSLEFIMLHPALTLRNFYPSVLILGGISLLATMSAPISFGDQQASGKTAEPHQRTFLFTYATSVTGLPAGKTARIWLPVPPSNEDQEVKIVSKELPAKEQVSREPRFGNRILHVEGKADAQGEIPLSMTYRVTRREVRGDVTKQAEDLVKLEDFLKPDARVPISGKPLELIKGKELPKDQVEAARVLYDVVNQHMRYSKEGTGWGRGDSEWACTSGYGNCTDFHSLFISLARSQKIPAKFEIGFPLPEKQGSGEVQGYHCWAKFRPAGKDWIPVDISEANKNPKMRDYYFGNLTEDRVTFTTGRDIDLVPKQGGEPLNFFVYPYVEVDGKPYSGEKVQRKFTYKDLTGE
jgi:transglutaminase-like putative cysteine protease